MIARTHAVVAALPATGSASIMSKPKVPCDAVVTRKLHGLDATEAVAPARDKDPVRVGRACGSVVE